MPLGLMTTRPCLRSTPLALPACMVTRPARKMPRFASHTSPRSFSETFILYSSPRSTRRRPMSAMAPTLLRSLQRLQPLHHVVGAAPEIIVQRLVLRKNSVVHFMRHLPRPVRILLQMRHLAGRFKDVIVASRRTSRSHGAVHGGAKRRAGERLTGNFDLAPCHVGIDLHQQMVLLRQAAAGHQI